MESTLSIVLGIGLSAACGFRIFVPFLIAGIASMLGYLPLAEGFEWIGTPSAVVLFGSATLLEVAAYYVPWIDNALDSIATPASVIAGTIAAASVITDLPPLLRWTLALIGGGGVAGAVQGATAMLRMGSTLVTGGMGNALVATGEWIAAVVTSLLAILLPLAGLVLVVVILIFSWRSRLSHRERREKSVNPQSHS